MKLNKFKVTSVFFFKSGNTKKVDWLEERLVKKVKSDDREVNEPLTLEEADAFFQGKFKEWKDKGATIVRKNVKGDNSIIPFAEVEYATVVVEQLGEEKVEEPKAEPVKATDSPRSIQDHPAFQSSGIKQ